MRSCGDHVLPTARINFQTVKAPAKTLLIAVLVMASACGSADTTPTTASDEETPPTTAVSTLTTITTAGTTGPTASAPATTPPATVTAGTTGAPRSLDDLVLTPTVVADGFEQPVFVTAPQGDARLFVVDQPGVVWVIDSGDPAIFLDIRERVLFGGEQGLLGLAFAPDFEATGLFYVNYVGAGPETRVAEFRSDGVVADADSERVLLTIDQPASNHNGGMIGFGPDGYLWIGMGDGGGRDDRFGTGQDPASLLGAMLRIDPLGEPYAVPESNPGPPFAAEIWAIGLRNPWRFSFDRSILWIGDVGQNAHEEINRIDVREATGPNFGWPRYEGSACYLSSDCADGDLVAPVFDYTHSEGCSVTGGYVYRGDAIPELTGHYFFGDFCGGWVRTLAPGSGPLDLHEWLAPGTVPGLSSFGVDGRGEIYVVSTDGLIYRLERAS